MRMPNLETERFDVRVLFNETVSQSSFELKKQLLVIPKMTESPKYIRWVCSMVLLKNIISMNY